MNPFQIANILRNGNPQQMVFGMLEQYSQGNPIMQNLLSLAKQGDSASIEQIARNMVASKGGNFDQEFAAFKQQFGL